VIIVRFMPAMVPALRMQGDRNPPPEFALARCAFLGKFVEKAIRDAATLSSAATKIARHLLPGTVIAGGK
jgi:hypothetical protein